MIDIAFVMRHTSIWTHPKLQPKLRLIFRMPKANCEKGSVNFLDFIEAKRR